MTEAEWLQLADPHPMLGAVDGQASNRKLRLFAVACCRRILHLTNDDRDRHLADVIERYADSRATKKELRAACRHLQELHDVSDALGAACAQDHLTNAAGIAVLAAANAAAGPYPGPAGMSAWKALLAAEFQAQVHLLRDVLGPLPFRRVPIDPVWLAWNGGTVRQLAGSVYEERAWERLPILADALEEAGCGDRDVLDHLRGSGPHTRGCWVVDLLLARERRP